MITAIVVFTGISKCRISQSWIFLGLVQWNICWPKPFILRVCTYLVWKMGSNIELSLSAPIDLSKTSSCCTMQCLSCLVRSEFFPKVGENFHCLWSLLRWLACQRWMLTVISMQPLHTVSFVNFLFRGHSIFT